MNPYEPPEETPLARKETDWQHVLEDPRTGIPVAMAICATLALILVALTFIYWG